MNCNTTHYRANSSSVPGDPTLGSISTMRRSGCGSRFSRFQSHLGSISTSESVRFRYLFFDGFNPTLVRLAQVCPLLPRKLQNCFNPTLVRLARLSNFRAPTRIQRFNPTLVRLARWAAAAFSAGRSRFNPTLVRLAPWSGRRMSFRPSVSIPPWFD